ncbi:galactose-3-O-sulfotransferase 2 [Pogona vitticeps]|uniref:Galactose-3-O-sulfotransferase 2 n=1 Tax=Pogona vitticeps TaxID=103695 RepID=A0A6J0T507_9SAUR
MKGVWRYMKPFALFTLWLGIVTMIGFVQQKTATKPWTIVKTCQPTTHVMFLKTHKTASSTILNILFRFSEKHNLTVALPRHNDVHLGYPYSFRASYVEEFKTIGPNFSIMCNHLRFKALEVKRVMPRDTFYFSILRHPASLLESSYVYYKSVTPAFRKSKNVNEFLSSPWNYYNLSERRWNIYAKNNMWFDFGYDNNAVYEEHYVQSVIQDVEQNFNLILIADYFDESMILLKDILCWDLDDVVYFKMNARSLDTVQTMNPESKEKVKEWCALDWMLYVHFNNTFWNKIQERMDLKTLYKEVEFLRKRQKELMETCLLKETDGTKIKDKHMKPFQSGSVKIMGYMLKEGLDNETLNTCDKMAIPELQYTAYMYSWQFPNKKKKSIPIR